MECPACGDSEASAVYCMNCGFECEGPKAPIPTMLRAVEDRAKEFNRVVASLKNGGERHKHKAKTRNEGGNVRRMAGRR